MVDQDIDALITQWKIAIDTPEIADVESSKVFLIRHGFSEFNMLHRQLGNIEDGNNEEFRKLKGDPALTDPDLHTIGVRQCEANAAKVEAINFTRCFVSPMQRALQTAIHMFKNHPNKANITFIVLPLIHEFYHTSNDIPADYMKVVNRYAPGQAECHGVKFDFSMILANANPQLWSAQQLTNVERQAKLLSRMPPAADLTWEKMRDTTIEVMLEYPYSFESEKDIWERAQSFKKWLRHYFEMRPMAEGEKAVFVCHSKFMSGCQASGWEQLDHPDKYQMVQGSYIWPLNCQTIPLKGWE